MVILHLSLQVNVTVQTSTIRNQKIEKFKNNLVYVAESTLIFSEVVIQVFWDYKSQHFL